MSPPAFQRAERLAKRVRIVYSFRRLTLRSATGTAQRARPYRRGGRSRMRTGRQRQTGQEGEKVVN